MSRTPSDPPMRQLMRLLTEMFMASHQRVVRLLPDGPMLGVELGIVARVCLPDWTQDGTLAPPVQPREAIPIRKIAGSLGGSPETTRRRINQLLEMGVLGASAAGISLATTADGSRVVLDYYRGLHDLILRFVEDLHYTCDVPLDMAAAPILTPRDVIARALDLLLRPIDTYRPPTISGQAYLLWGALTAVAVRGVTYDPELARRYANDIPPDELRQATSLHRLAAALPIPYATAWRHMRELLDAGLVTRLSDDRWTVLSENLRQQAARDSGEPPSLFALRMVRELCALGLNPARVADRYLAGRPEVAQLG